MASGSGKEEWTDDTLLSIFKSWDKDNSGALTLSEVREGLLQMNLPTSDTDLRHFIDSIDSNRDGVVTFPEFCRILRSKERDIRAVFQSLDTDKSGFIDEKELAEALQRLSLPWDVKAVRRLFRRLDGDGDGRITFSEFREVLVHVPEASLEQVMDYWERAALLDESDHVAGSITVASSSANSTLINGAAGACSSVLSKTGTAPVERLKILYQTHTTKPPSMAKTLMRIWEVEGFRGLFRGNFVNLMKSTPESSVKFAVFEKSKEMMTTHEGEKLSKGLVFLAGAAGGVAAHTSCFPLEVLKTKISGSPHGTYSSIVDCIKKTYAQGGVSGFYRGLTPVIFSTIPHAGTSLMTYQVSKEYFAALQGEKEPGAVSLMAAATISTVCGQTVSAPMHVLKTRMIMGPGDHGHGHTDYGNTTLDVVKNTWKREGIQGFFRGYVPTLVKGIPAHIISFGVYEYFRHFYGVEKHKKGH